ncbi:MAG: DUF3970 family protein [Clostridia bacterium]|nr:DUF3970 family protein [Clostridia bacterium]
MVKVRLTGKEDEIGRVIELLEEHQELEVLEVSRPYKNDEGSKYYRIYIDLDLKNL